MPTNRKRTSRKPIKAEPDWKAQFRIDFKKYADYEDFMNLHRPLSYEQWRFVARLIRAEGPKYKKSGNRYEPI